ncbi:hypothetical protein HRbin41_00430 [bacterium HR41]|nr:hypothetical protein HRbin41_00430 [bacterium HR41]
MEVVRIDLDLHLLGFGQDGDGGGRGVDPPLRLGNRHTLDAMGTGLVLEHAVGALALDREGVVPVAGFERLDAETAPLGVASEHAEEVAGEKASFFAAGSRSDLDDRVLAVVRIRLHRRQADLLGEFGHLRLGLLGQRAQLGIVALAEHLARPLEVGARTQPRLREPVRFLERPPRARHLGVAAAVAEHLGVGELSFELGVAALDLFDELLDHRRSA